MSDNNMMSTFNVKGGRDIFFFFLDMMWLKMDNRSNLLKYQEKCRFVLHCNKDWICDGSFVRTLRILVLWEIRIKSEIDIKDIWSFFFFDFSPQELYQKKKSFQSKIIKAEKFIEHFPTFPGHAEKKNNR